jgi:hypothetical protein
MVWISQDQPAAGCLKPGASAAAAAADCFSLLLAAAAALRCPTRSLLPACLNPLYAAGADCSVGCGWPVGSRREVVD